MASAGEMREKFKQYVNTLASIKLDENDEKILVLKKKYRQDASVVGGNNDTRARSEPPTSPGFYLPDNTDGAGPSRVRSDGNLSGSALRSSGSSSTLASTPNDSTSLASVLSSSSLSSGDPEDVNASVVSVKERAKHLNRMESESEIQKVSTSNLGAVRKKESRKNRDLDDDSSTNSTCEPLGPLERDWLVKCSSSDYHLMNELLSKNPQLVTVKDFTSGTALHWAAMHGRVEVIKMLMSNSGVHVNQRTGYTPLHLAAIQGHEAIIEILVNTFKADPNIRDYSGKKAKQYLRNSASSRAQQLLVSSRLSTKSVTDESDAGFTRNSGNRRSNRGSAIRSLIRASTGAMKQHASVIKSSWGSTEDLNSGNTTPRSTPSPRNSAEPSPVIRRRRGSFKGRDNELMPPPHSGSIPFRNKQRSSKHSMSKESLHSEDKQLSLSKKQVPRSESEPNLGEALQPSKTTFI